MGKVIDLDPADMTPQDRKAASTRGLVVDLAPEDTGAQFLGPLRPDYDASNPKTPEGQALLQAQYDNMNPIEKAWFATKALGETLAAAPGKMLNNPGETAKAYGRGWTQAMGLGLDTPEDVEARVARFKAGTQTLADDMTRLRKPPAAWMGRDPNEVRLATARGIKQADAAAANQPVAAMLGAGTAPNPENVAAGMTLEAIPAASLAAKMGRGAAVGGGLGAIGGAKESAVSGGSPGEIAAAAGRGLGLGALTGAGAELGAAGAQKALSWAPGLARKQEGQLLTQGADATHSRRAMGMKGENLPAMIDFADSHPEIKAAEGHPEKMAAATEDIANRYHATTGPIYDEFDQVVGPASEPWVLNELDRRIAETGQKHGQEGLRDALQGVRDDFAETAAKRAAAGKPWPHQDMREWVTEILKNKQRTVGSLNATKQYDLVDAIHGVANDILKDELAQAVQVAPQLAPQAEQLSAANREIAISLALKQAAENAIGRDLTAKGGILNRLAHTSAGKLALHAIPVADRAMVRGAAAVAQGAGEAPAFAATNALARAREAEQERNRKRAEALTGAGP